MAATPLFSDCPGCSVHLPVSQAYADERFNASAECWQLYGELTGYTVAQAYSTGTFLHQLAVDTYAAQHANDTAPPIRTAFALIGLYFAFERGYTGQQVQHMHTLLARRSKRWPRFAPPAVVGAVTVWDVLRAEPGEQRDAMLRRWGQSVWDAWQAERARVASLTASVMGDE